VPATNIRLNSRDRNSWLLKVLGNSTLPSDDTFVGTFISLNHLVLIRCLYTQLICINIPRRHLTVLLYSLVTMTFTEIIWWQLWAWILMLFCIWPKDAMYFAMFYYLLPPPATAASTTTITTTTTTNYNLQQCFSSFSVKLGDCSVFLCWLRKCYRKFFITHHFLWTTTLVTSVKTTRKWGT